MNFQHHLETRVHIRASAVRVWTVLMDFEQYPQWNPFIRRLQGSVEPGQSLRVEVQPVGGRPMKFRPKVLAVQQASELRWLGKLLFKGLFDGEHYFKLERAPNGVIFVHGEQFRGLLVPLLRRMLQQQTLPGFEAMNQALLDRAERFERDNT